MYDLGQRIRKADVGHRVPWSAPPPGINNLPVSFELKPGAFVKFLEHFFHKGGKISPRNRIWCFEKKLKVLDGFFRQFQLLKELAWSPCVSSTMNNVLSYKAVERIRDIHEQDRNRIMFSKRITMENL